MKGQGQKKTFAYWDSTLYYSRGLQELTTSQGQASKRCSSESEQTVIYTEICSCTVYLYKNRYGSPEGARRQGRLPF